MTRWSKSLSWMALLVVIAACGSKPGDLRRIKGTITGLTGEGLVLQLNGGHGLPIAANATAFDFTDKGTWMVEGANYSVTVDAGSSIHDPVQHCTVQNGSGTVGSTDVTNVAVTCIGVDANLTGLELSGVALRPAFSAETTAYSGEVAFTVESVTVTPKAEDGKATIKVNEMLVQSGSASLSISLAAGANTIIVIVTAEDGVTGRSYRVTINRQDVDAGTWVEIQPGTFTMGSPDTELGRFLSREDQHQVTLTRGFVMLSTEVTQAEFSSRMGYNPSFFKSCGDNCPVENVNWHEAAAYCNALSVVAGHASCYTCTGTGTAVSCTPSASYDSPNGTPYDCPGYRLPTEAEWEYAVRATTTTATYQGDLTATDCTDTTLTPIAWFCGNSTSTTHMVGTLNRNGWDLYDMLGNVFEWCHDWWGDYPTVPVTDPSGPTTGSYRVIRGGSWVYSARGARAAFRYVNVVLDGRGNYLGLRPVRSF